MSVIEKFQEGLMFFNDGQLNEALAIFTSLTNEEFEDRIFKIMAYKSIANIYTLKNDYERAINYSKLAFEYYETEGNIEEKINSILSIGNLYADKGDIEKTIEYYTQAVKIYDENKDSDQIEKAVTLLDLAVICLEKANNINLAKNYFNQSLLLYEKYANISVKIKTLIDIGTIFLEKGDINDTLQYFEEAIKLHDDIPFQKAQLLIDLGKSLISQSKYDRGLEYFERGFKLFENISPEKLPDEIFSVGIYLESIRELDYSIEFLKRSFDLYVNLNDIKGRVNVLINLGEIYSKLGQIEHSTQFYEEALNSFGKEFDDSEKALILMGLGNVLSNKGKIDKAMDYFEDALKTFESKQDKNNKAKVLQLIGRAYNKKNELDEAISYYESSYAIFLADEFNISREKASCINELGSIYLKLKNYDKAFEYFSKSLGIADKSQDPLSKADPLVYIGLIHYQKNDMRKANEFFSKGFELLASRQDPFDILQTFDEFYNIDENLAFEHALNSAFGLLWIFTKYNEILEGNKNISVPFWKILRIATQNWWSEIFDNRDTIFNNIYGDKIVITHRFRETTKEVKTSKGKTSQFESNWLLKQLIKATQEPLTNDSIVNMLLGANDLITPDSEDLSVLRDVQADLEPIWFVELPSFLRHNEDYLKIRLNNRIKRFGKLIGYPLLDKVGTSIKSMKVTFETQWLQRYIIDHIFVPNSQYEYESYEINPANTWLTDVYIMDLSENLKKFNQLELTYRIELELDAKDDSGNNISIKTTNKRIIIPVYRKNNFENFQKFMAKNNTALAVFIALFAVFFDFFDLLANFWDFPTIFTSWLKNPRLIITYLMQWFFPIIFIVGVLAGLATIPFYLWGRRKKNSFFLKEKIN